MRMQLRAATCRIELKKKKCEEVEETVHENKGAQVQGHLQRDDGRTSAL